MEGEAAEEAKVEGLSAEEAKVEGVAAAAEAVVLGGDSALEVALAEGVPGAAGAGAPPSSL